MARNFYWYFGICNIQYMFCQNVMSLGQLESAIQTCDKSAYVHWMHFFSDKRLYVSGHWQGCHWPSDIKVKIIILVKSFIIFTKPKVSVETVALLVCTYQKPLHYFMYLCVVYLCANLFWNQTRTVEGVAFLMNFTENSIFIFSNHGNTIHRNQKLMHYSMYLRVVYLCAKLYWNQTKTVEGVAF